VRAAPRTSFLVRPRARWDFLSLVSTYGWLALWYTQTFARSIMCNAPRLTDWLTYKRSQQRVCCYFHNWPHNFVLAACTALEFLFIFILFKVTKSSILFLKRVRGLLSTFSPHIWKWGIGWYMCARSLY